jgi:hypothetical protein
MKKDVGMTASLKMLRSKTTLLRMHRERIALEPTAKRAAIGNYPRYGDLLEVDGEIFGAFLRISFRSRRGRKSHKLLQSAGLAPASGVPQLRAMPNSAAMGLHLAGPAEPRRSFIHGDDDLRLITASFRRRRKGEPRATAQGTP